MIKRIISEIYFIYHAIKIQAERFCVSGISAGIIRSVFFCLMLVLFCLTQQKSEKIMLT